MNSRKSFIRSQIKRITALMTGMLFLVSVNPALAQSVPNNPNMANTIAPAQIHVAHQAVMPVTPAAVNNVVNIASQAQLPAGGYQLDLTSTASNVILGTDLFQGAQSVFIRVGGQVQKLTPGSQVTPAEYVAAQQVLRGGAQNLVLNSGGAATGGSFAVNQVAQTQMSGLVVPHNVKGIENASLQNTAQLTGDLVNYGSIFALSTNKANNTATLFANNIVNEAGGLISTRLPASLLRAFPASLGSLNLVLGATNDITNYGTIASTGSLTLTAVNGAITNTQGAGNGLALITAAKDVNLYNGSGNFTNNGLIASTGANINIGTVAPTDVNVNAVGGAFKALAGDINIGAIDHNITLTGGDYLSKNLNMFAGTGGIFTNIGNVTGAINTVSAADHIWVAAPNMILGNNCVNGDPTFVNTAGDITISGANTFTENVAIIASKNINAAAGPASIVAHGFNVTLVAGASASTTDVSTTTVPGTNIGAGKTATVDFSTPSATGGNIDFTPSTTSKIIDTSSTTGNAGNVMLAARANGAAGGNISTLGTQLIDTHSTVAAGGNVSVIGGGANVIGNITTGGATNSGNVRIAAANPTTNDSNPITFDNTGVVTSGNFIVVGTQTNNNVSVQTINTSGNGGAGSNTSGLAGKTGGNGGNINISAGGSVGATNLWAFGGGGGGGVGGDGVAAAGTNGGAGGNGGSITINAGTAALLGGVNTSGGGGGGGGGGGADTVGAATTTAGSGGAGGSAGGINIAVTNGPAILTYAYAADGGNGGNGATGINNFGGSGFASPGAGGGGGASLGGGGAGGGSGIVQSGLLFVADGGSGAGGINGGGGGAGSGNATAILSGGGTGGGGVGGGAGGTGFSPGFAASGSSGGSGGLGTPGGTLGNPGTGGFAFATPGANGGALKTGVNNNDISIGAKGIGINGFGPYAVYGRDLTFTDNVGSNGGFSYGGTIVGTNSTSITADGSGNIAMLSAGQLIRTPSLTLLSGTGNIGTATNPIKTDAGTLTALTGNGGSAFVDDTNIAGVTVVGASGAGTTGTEIFALRSASTLFVSNTITAAHIGLEAPSIWVFSPISGAAITLNNPTGDMVVVQAGGSISTTKALTLAAAGNIDIGNGAIGLDTGFFNYGTSNITIVAGNSVLNSGFSASTINTGSAGPVGNVTMVAGATYTLDIMQPSTVTVTGASGVAPGNIQLNGGPGREQLNISTNGGLSGGNVTLISFNGTVTQDGLIDADGGTGTGGTVLIMGSNGVFLNNITSQGNNGGTVGLASAAVTMPNGSVSYADGSTTDPFSHGLATNNIWVGGVNSFGGNLPGSVGIEGDGIVVNGTIFTNNLAIDRNDGSLQIGGGGFLIGVNSISLSSSNQLDLGPSSGIDFFNRFGYGSGANLLFVAGQNIGISGGGGTATIDTSVGLGNGGDVTMVAGGAYSFAVNAPTLLTVNGPSGLGGSIDLTSGGGKTGITAINTSTTDPNGSGGNLNLIAWSNGAVGGHVLMDSNSTINTSGAEDYGTPGTNGNITVIAGAQSGVAISLGDINTELATGSGKQTTSGTGTVFLFAAQPVLNPSPVVFLGGNQTLGAFNAPSIQPNSSIQVGNITAPGATVDIEAGGGINTGNILTAGAGAPDSASFFPPQNGTNAGSIILDASAGFGSVFTGWLRAYGGGGSGASGPMPGGQGGNGGDITINTSNVGVANIFVAGDINASGGGGGGGGFAGPGGNGGNGGSVNVTSIGTIGIVGPVLAAAGGGGGAGDMGANGGSGGGSFGGGGGGGDGGAGGGGFVGGGGSSSGTWGGGGGVFGVGVGGGTGTAGSNGLGGNGSIVGATGGNFGQGGQGPTAGGNAGQDAAIGPIPPGSAGNGGFINLSGDSVNIFNSIHDAGINGVNGYTFASFLNSPFQKDFINAVGHNPGASGEVLLTSVQPVTLPYNIDAGGMIVLDVPQLTVNSGITLTGGSFSIITGSLSNAGAIHATTGDVGISGLTNQGATTPPAVPNVSNSGTITSDNGNIFVVSDPGQNVVVNGGGTMSAPNGSISLTATDTAPPGAANGIIFSGNQNFITAASPNGTFWNANGPNQFIWIQSGVTVTANNSVTANTGDLIMDGSVVANPFQVVSPNGGLTISNTAGDLNLPANFVFHGQNLALLSFGNINGTGIGLIDLSGDGTNNNGGNLFMLAGFNLQKLPNGDVNVLTPSPSGSINLSSVTINTSSAFGNGGDVLAFTHDGTITLGDINTSSTFAGGNAGGVLLAGHGITTGAISALGGLPSVYPIELYSAVFDRAPGATPVVHNGLLVGIAYQQFQPNFGSESGDIFINGSVNTGSASFVAVTGGTGSFNTAVVDASFNPCVITSGFIGITTGTGGAGTVATPLLLSSSTGTLAISAQSTGSVYLSSDVNNTGLFGSSAQTMQLTLTGATAGLTIGGNVNVDNLTVNVINGGPIALNAGSHIFGYGSNPVSTNIAFNTNTLNVGSGAVIDTAALQVTGVDTAAPVDNFTLNNAGTIHATTGNINIASVTDGSVFITGGGTVKSDSGNVNITATGTGGSTNFIEFTGSQTFGGTTNLNATQPLQSIVFDSGVTVTGLNTLNLNTNNLNFGNNVTLTGNPLVWNSPLQVGTIANSNGDVNLTSSIHFNGESLTILASGSVNAPNITIDLSNSTAFNGGDGGTLHIFAGYDFVPSTSGQQNGPSGVVYTITGPSLSGGNVNLTGTNISTGTTFAGADGGDVNILAHEGLNAAGTVSVGDINTSATATGAAGSIFIAGKGGITTGLITAGDGAGVVALLAGTPTITGTVQVWNGLVNPFTPAPLFNVVSGSMSGNIVLGGADVGNTIFIARTDAAGSITAKPGTILTSTTLVDLEAGTGGIGTSANPVATNTPNALLASLDSNSGLSGDVFVTGAAPVTHLGGSNVGRNFNFTMVGTGGSIVIDALSDIIGTTSVTLTAANGGSITQNGVTGITAPKATLLTDGGDIGSNAQPISLDSSTVTANAGTTGNVWIIDTSGTGVTLAGANAGNNFNFRVIPNGKPLTLASGATIDGTTSVTLTLNNGDLSQADNTSSITTATAIIDTQGGNIGSSSQFMNINADNLFTNTNGTGNVFVKDTNAAVAVFGTNNVNSYTLHAPNGVVTLTNIDSIGAAGAVEIDATGLSADGAINAVGDITIKVGAGTVTTNNNIFAGTPISPANVLIEAGNLVANSNAFVGAWGDTTIRLGSSGVLTINGSGAVTAANDVNITAGEVDINNVAGQISAANVNPTGAVTINAGTNLSGVVFPTATINNQGIITGNTIVLSVTDLTNGGLIGSSVFPPIVNNGGVIINGGAVGAIQGLSTSVDNSGTIVANADIQITSQDVKNSGSLNAISSSVLISANTVENFGAAASMSGSLISINGPLATSATKVTTDAGSTMNAGDITIVTNKLDNSGSITASSNLFVLGGSVINQAGGALSGGNIGMVATDVTNNGAITVTGSTTGYFSVTGLDSNVVASPFSGTGTITGEKSLTLAALHQLDITDLLSQTSGALSGVNVLLVAGGDINNNSSTNSSVSVINTSNITGAGSISIVAGANWNTTGPSQVTVTGPSATGGIIDFTTANGVGFDTTSISGGAGGDGGNVTLIAFQGSTQFSGTIQTLASNNIVTGGDANSGSVNVMAGGNNPNLIVIQNLVPVTGGAITLGDISTSSDLFGNLGGKAPINIYSGQPDAGTGVSFTDAVSLGSFAPPAPLGAGSIAVGTLTTNHDSITVKSAGDVNLLGATGHNYTFEATNATLTLPTDTLAAQRDGSGNGGSIDLTGGAIIFLGATSLTNPLTLDASGSTGAGGSVTVHRNSTSLLVIGNDPGDLDINVSGGTNGGIVNVHNGGQLYVVINPASHQGLLYNGANGDGALLTFEAGTMTTATLTVSGNLSANAVGTGPFDGGSITLISNSPTAFNIGSTLSTNKNGVQGVLAVNGAGAGNPGSVTVINRGGGILYNPAKASALTNVANVDFEAWGTNSSIQIKQALGGASTTNVTVRNFGTNSGVVIGAPINTPNALVDIGSRGNGTVTEAGGATVTAASVNLDVIANLIGAAGKGTIGTTAPFVINSPIVSAIGLGSVNIKDTSTGAVALNTSASQTSSFKLVTAGALTTSGLLAAGTDISLTAAGAISSDALIGATKSVTMTAGTSISTTQDVTAGTTINLKASNGGITTDNDFNAGTTLTMLAKGDLNLTGDITAKTVTISSNATNGSIDLDGSITTPLTKVGTTPAGTVTLTATGTGHIANNFLSAGFVQGGTVTLKTGTGGKIGNPGNPFRVGAVKLAVNSQSTGGVDLENETTNALTITQGLVKGSFNLTSPGSITVGASLATATSVFLDASGPNANILVNLPIGHAGTGATSNVTLQVDTNGNISGAGKITATNLDMSTNDGNIGTAKAAMNVASPNLIQLVAGGTGLVNVKDTSTSATTLGIASSGGNFSLNTSASTTLNGITTDAGNIVVIEAGGTLTVGTNAVITANGGSMTLENSNTSTGKIVINNNAQISTAGPGGGPLNIVIGAVPKTPVLGIFPSGCIIDPVGTGQIFFGTKGITIGPGTAPIARFNAINTNLVFNAGNNAANITVNQGVIITADPPAPAALNMPTIAQPVGGSILNSQPVVPATLHVDSVSTSTPATTSSAANGSNNVIALNAVPSVPNLSAAVLAQIAAQVMQSGSQTTGLEGWISETELRNGEIPAVLSSDAELIVKPGTSAIVDMKVAKASGANKSVNLNKGSVVFAPTKDMVVATGYGDVKVAANSIVLIMSFHGGVAVYDLHDTRKDAVSVVCGGHSIELHPGYSTVLTDNTTHSFDEVNPAQLFLYRNVVEHSVGNTVKAYVGEFHPLSALHAVQPLRNLVNAKQPEARKLGEQMLKTAAIVLQTRGARGKYQQVLRPSVAAWQQ